MNPSPRDVLVWTTMMYLAPWTMAVLWPVLVLDMIRE